MLRAHVTGLDSLIREFGRKIDGMEEALDEGCLDAAEYLQEKIEDKFGTYQKGWKPLLYKTIAKERKMGYGANATKPLVMSGDMMFSFATQISNKTRKHTVAIVSDDEKLPYHMYGVPSEGVPKRDPVRPTVKEEREACYKIVRDKVKELMDGKI